MRYCINSGVLYVVWKAGGVLLPSHPRASGALPGPHEAFPVPRPTRKVSPGSDRLAVIGTEPSCILLYDLASMVLKGRLGKSGRKGCSSLGVYSNGGGGGGTAALPRPYRPRSSGAITAGGDAFLHAGFSGDGAELLAFTATKLFRFPLGGG